MQKKKVNLEKLHDHLNDKFRFVVLNDETFEEKSSLRLTRFNIYAALMSVFVLVFTVSFVLIYFTPIKYTIPGYGNEKTRATLLRLETETDSLKNVVEKRNIYLQNLKKVLSGMPDSGYAGFRANTAGLEFDSAAMNPDAYTDVVDGPGYVGNNESPVLEEIVENRKFVRKSIRDLHFISPVDGYVTAEFDVRTEHYGIDLGAKDNAPVKSVLEGTVIQSDWTIKTGYVIAVQHTDDLISFYKHNSKLLKKAGDRVNAGEVVAIIGNSGELTTGPHLHFELWAEGEPVDPRLYINF